jgi:hypothetical protein
LVTIPDDARTVPVDRETQHLCVNRPHSRQTQCSCRYVEHGRRNSPIRMDTESTSVQANTGTMSNNTSRPGCQLPQPPITILRQSIPRRASLGSGRPIIQLGSINSLCLPTD